MLKNIKIGTRLGLGFGLILLLLLATGISGLWGTRTLSSTTTKMLNTEAHIAEFSGEVRAHVLGLRRFEKDMFLNMGSSEKQAKYFSEWNKEFSELTGHLTDLEKVVETSEDKEAVRSMRERLSVYESGFRKIYGEIQAGKITTPQDGNKAITEYKDSIHSLDEKAEALVKSGVDGMDSKEKYLESFASKIIWTIVALLVTAFGASIIVSFFTTRRIARPLNAGVHMSEEIANGDLNSADLEVKSTDELGVLAGTLNKMKSSLSKMIGSIAGTSGQVASASEELSVTVQQITKRVGEQAERAAQVATSATEMSQTVIDIAKNASNIANSAKDTVKVADQGADVVNQTVKEVQEIALMVTESSKMMATLGERSRQIGEIVTVINDIADQTNLLALNAAIEAARAGEQGRGFAVVADEVKKLAERTTKATTEIGSMIKAIQDETGKSVASMKTSIQKVELGVNLSKQSGDSLKNIVESVSGLQTMVEQIASATEQMSSVSGQISDYIEVIANISKETQSSSEGIADASTDLSRLSVELKEMTDQFRVAKGGADVVNISSHTIKKTKAPSRLRVVNQ